MDRIIFLLIFVLHFRKSQNKNISYTYCTDTDEIIPKKVKDIPNKNPNTFKLLKVNKDDFQDFNIVLELKNIETEIKLYNLTKYESLLINSLKKAVQTIKSLIKVIPYSCYNFNEDFLDEYGFYYWDRDKFGIYKYKNYFNTCDYNIDLLIVTRFFNKNEKDTSIIKSSILYVREQNGQPIVGSLKINKDFDFSKNNTKNFLNIFFFII